MWQLFGMGAITLTGLSMWFFSNTGGHWRAVRSPLTTPTEMIRLNLSREPVPLTRHILIHLYSLTQPNPGSPVCNLAALESVIGPQNNVTHPSRKERIEFFGIFTVNGAIR